jgi:hypothetical protein
VRVWPARVSGLVVSLKIDLITSSLMAMASRESLVSYNHHKPQAQPRPAGPESVLVINYYISASAGFFYKSMRLLCCLAVVPIVGSWTW